MAKIFSMDDQIGAYISNESEKMRWEKCLVVYLSGPVEINISNSGFLYQNLPIWQKIEQVNETMNKINFIKCLALHFRATSLKNNYSVILIKL